MLVLGNIFGQKKTSMIPIYSTTILYDEGRDRLVF